MAGKIFLEFFPQTSRFFTSRLNLWGCNGARSYSTSERIKVAVKGRFETMQELSFEQFKRTRVKPFEEFQESPRIKALFSNDRKRELKAYEDYCIYKFNRYKLAKYGGNPGTMA